MKIILTHLNDLNSFYVQKLTLQNFLKNLNFYIEHERNGKLAWNDVRIRRTYGVLYETKKTSCWRRGRLMDIIYKDGNFLYKIFFIDYGNTNWVTIDKLKEIRHSLIRRSPFAVQCKLTNPNGIIYDANAHIQLAQIIGKCELHMQHIENGCGPARVKEVDLFIPTSKGTFVSVRKILFQIETTELKEILLAYNAKLLENTKKLEVGQEEQVIVTHVGDDPFKLYIQLASNIDILNKMKHDMKLFYENQNASCIPVEDSDAVIYYQHPNQGDWHRARIISVNNKSQHVDVFFVDWGGLGTVPWSSVKLLKEKFIKMECQAIAVKLAHIHQCSAEARDFLNEQLLSTEGNYKMIIASKEEAEIYLPSSLSLNDLIMQKYPHLVRFTNKVTLGQFENENSKDNYEEENDAQNVEHDNCMEDKKSKFENNDGPHLVIFTNKVTLGQFENENNKDKYEEENDAQHVEHDNCMEDKKSKFQNNDGPHLVRFTNKVTLGQFENEYSKDNYEEKNDAQHVEHDNCMEDENSEFENNDDVLSAYIYAPIPKSTHGKCKMSIVDVTKLNFKYNVVLNISNNEISTNSEDFKTLSNEIQKFVKNEPILKKIETNEPCICFNVKNKSWCRAVIYDNLGYGYASVMFVDYGNVETVNVENIKVMRPKWFNFPVYNRTATINIELKQINRFHHVLTYLINLRGKSVSVEIVSENPLKVHLYHGKKLCYQNLIDYGIVSAL